MLQQLSALFVYNQLYWPIALLKAMPSIVLHNKRLISSNWVECTLLYTPYTDFSLLSNINALYCIAKYKRLMLYKLSVAACWEAGHWGWHVTFSTPHNRCALDSCCVLILVQQCSLSHYSWCCMSLFTEKVHWEWHVIFATPCNRCTF